MTVQRIRDKALGFAVQMRGEFVFGARTYRAGLWIVGVGLDRVVMTSGELSADFRTMHGEGR